MSNKQMTMIVALGVLMGPATALAQYDYRQIDYPGQAQSAAWGINDSGDVVAYGYDPDDTIPFIVSSMDGTITDVAPAAGYLSTALLGINNAGVTAGSVISLDGNTRSGVVRSSDGEYTVFDHPDALEWTSARGINNRGIVSGIRDGGAVNQFRGFIYDSGTGTFTDIDTGASEQAIAHGINSKGEVAGDAVYLAENNPCVSAAVSFARYGWLRRTDGTVLYFQVNGQRTTARGINDAGYITGNVLDPFTGELKGYVIRAPKTNCASIAVDTSELLQVPGAFITFPEGITNSGEVVGQFFDLSGVTHGFIATEQ